MSGISLSQYNRATNAFADSLAKQGANSNGLCLRSFLPLCFVPCFVCLLALLLGVVCFCSCLCSGGLLPAGVLVFAALVA
ncbi:hypothetical protein Q3G72_018294 [Acer saccharum]|nr:hypothetical protein Q3G72_018294 [Acer saccharum]